MITSPGRIRIRLKLKGAGARKEQAIGDGTMEVAENTKKVSIVELCGSRNELTQNMNSMKNVRTSNPKVNKAPNKVTIASGIIKGSTISRPQWFGCLVSKLGVPSSIPNPNCLFLHSISFFSSC